MDSGALDDLLYGNTPDFFPDTSPGKLSLLWLWCGLGEIIFTGLGLNRMDLLVLGGGLVAVLSPASVWRSYPLSESLPLRRRSMPAVCLLFSENYHYRSQSCNS